MSDEFRKADESEQVELIADYECETGEGPLWHVMSPDVQSSSRKS